MMHQLFYTRMIGLWNLSILHALLRRAHPIDRTQELFILAREAESQLARRHMLSRPLLTVRVTGSQFVS